MDLSGTLTSINNTRSIQANLSPNEAGDPLTGTTTAIDVRANTSGVTVHSDRRRRHADHRQSRHGRRRRAGRQRTAHRGRDQAGLRSRHGRYPQRPDMLGDIAFGAGADRLIITGGAAVRGALSDTGGDLAIDVTNGTLDARQTTRTNITSLNVGSAGDLIITLDPANNAAGGFNVAGTATLANGAGLGVRFTSLLTTPGRFTLIDATTLNFGAIDLDSIETNSPYIYKVDAGADVPAGEVFVDVRKRTAEEAELIPVEADMYDAVYTSLGDPDAIEMRNAFLAQNDRDGFINLYEQLLPEHSGGPLLSLASGVDAVTRALTGRNASAAPGETSAWVQEITFYADKDKTDTYGFRSEGFGVAGGVERGTGLGNVGITAAFTSSDLEDPEAEAEEVLSANLFELGLYWRAQGQYWTTWARAAAGYATFDLGTPVRRRRSEPDQHLGLERLQPRRGRGRVVRAQLRTLQHPPRGLRRIFRT
jgi:hypothetical protein